MINKGVKLLESNRLILRKFKINDADKVYNNWANDDENTKFLSWNSHKNINDSIEYLNSLLDLYQNDLSAYHWGIVIK